jgi:hypothetical protein
MSVGNPVKQTDKRKKDFQINPMDNERMPAPLRERASVDEVENIYLFVADSVREQTTSDAVTSLGVSGRAIAASTYTASSFSSILSGQYPSTHCVWSFNDRLPKRPPLLDGPETFGMTADTIWTDLPPAEKPPFQMVNATADDATSVTELDPPFIAVEHHKGGHMPYGFTFEKYPSIDRFFLAERPTLEELPVLYAESVRTAEECFLAAVDKLAERDLLEKTLVIYTSDHGEALGEAANAAIVGHGDPIAPDLVEVSVVFAGVGLPDTDIDALLSGVDVAPTALAALGRSGQRENGDSVDWRVDGQNCWTGTPGDRLLRSERWVTYEAVGLGELDRYRATSVWAADGGLSSNGGAGWRDSDSRSAMSLGRHRGLTSPGTRADRTGGLPS